MTHELKHVAFLFPLAVPLFLAGCGVSQSEYDALKAQNQQLQQQVTADAAQIARLREAIRYTVNSDLLFPSGGWEISEDGKKIIGKLAEKLAPTQQAKIMVNGYTDNKPIGPVLKRQGITSNQELSQKRADSVMQYMISQGVKPDLITAHGYGEADPVASNDTPQGRAQNRRVEITLAPSG
jgi:chemotaxis protein MotB